MDDLDALLADLQTNLNRVSPHPASPLHHTTPPRNTTPPANNRQVDFTRTVQVEHHNNRNGDQQQQHIYQNEDHRGRNDQNYHPHQNGFHTHEVGSNRTGDRTPVTSSQNDYQNSLLAKDKMYRHETREEVRTETRSSGPNPTSPRSGISNNLSELDSLLHDLNTTKQNSIIKESTVINGNRPSVDSLLDELNSVGHRETSEKRTTIKETRTTHPPPPPVPVYTHKVSHVSASNATKELDDLMESLSDFKGVSRTTDTTKETKVSDVKQKQFQNRSEEEHYQQYYAARLPDDAPPRPPSPNERDAFPVPPPRPPAPAVVYAPSDIYVPAVLPAPIVPSPTPATVSIIYTQPDQPQHRVRDTTNLVGETSDIESSCTGKRYCYISYGSPPDSLVEDAFIRPESGGPVKRNDAEYRWVTDQIKHEIREVVERPSPPPVMEPKIKVNRINADTAYAKPIPKRRSPSPPKPLPKPTPPNQLDSMLGSLTSHMTEQGINTSQKGCCCACDKPIVGQVITALGKTWHPEHFVCAHCKMELGTKNFFERDGKPYCEPDYHNLFSPKCAYCSGPILDKCVTAMNKTWHPEHFFCAQCGNTFGEEGFHEKNGKPYCKEDYFNMFAPKCGGCNNPIMENYISALNSQWHPECFVCRDCKQSVSSKAFYEIEGKPVCGECLGVEDDGDEEEEDED